MNKTLALVIFILTSSAASADQLNCAAAPSRCGYPDQTNTGSGDPRALRRVPEDVSAGPGWKWDERGWVDVYGDDAVFSGYVVNTSVSVTGNGATISRSRIAVGGETFGVAIRHAANVTVRDCTIGPADQAPRLMVGVKDIYGDAVGTVVEKNNIFSVATGVQISAGVIQDNYIHSLKEIEGDHVNGITSNGSQVPLVIRHNTIFNPISQTDAIGLFPDFGAEANRTIDGNLLAGGGYVIYAGQKDGAPDAYDIVITNNRFSRVYFPKGGFFGHITGYPERARWGNNIWDETLEPAILP